MKNGRNKPRVYCRFGVNNKKVYRICIGKDFPTEGPNDLLKMIKEYFSRIHKPPGSRKGNLEVNVQFYWGKLSKKEIADQVTVTEQNIKSKELAITLKNEMRRAYDTAREQLKITSGALT